MTRLAQAVLGLVSLFVCAATTRAADASWNPVWSDEFNGRAIDRAKWEFEVNAQGGGNHELQYYTDRAENARIENGCLVLEARPERYRGAEGTRDYTSARLRTRQRGDWKYCRVEVRAQLPRTQGLWPAIWMLPTKNAYGDWPHSGEIDIMELLGHEPNKVYGTLHYADRKTGLHAYHGGSFVLPRGTFADDFHVFAVEWEQREIRWYVDGVRYATETNWQTDRAPYPAPFDQTFHLVLNVAVGGDWPGNPDRTTVLPQQMRVDYVRVYERRKATE
jgi:beta-glucanase (GH16 family)